MGLVIEDCLAMFLSVYCAVVWMVLWGIFVIDKIFPPMPSGKDKYRGWEGWGG